MLKKRLRFIAGFTSRWTQQYTMQSWKKLKKSMQKKDVSKNQLQMIVSNMELKNLKCNVHGTIYQSTVTVKAKRCFVVII